MKKRLKQYSAQQGFTLIELILYVAILSIFIGSLVLFAWDVLLADAQSRVQRVVHQQLRFVGQRIGAELRSAASIHSLTSNAICLESFEVDRNPTHIYLSNGQVRMGWGGGGTDCTATTVDEPITSSELTVTNLTFTNLSPSALSQNVSFELTMESDSDRQEWQYAKTLVGAVELRSN